MLSVVPLASVNTQAYMHVDITNTHTKQREERVRETMRIVDVMYFSQFPFQELRFLLALMLKVRGLGCKRPSGGLILSQSALF